MVILPWKLILTGLLIAGLMASESLARIAAAEKIRITVAGPHTGFATEFGAGEYRGAELGGGAGGKIEIPLGVYHETTEPIIPIGDSCIFKPSGILYCRQ